MREPREFDLQWEGRRCIVRELGAAEARHVARRVTNVVGTALREGGSAGLEAHVQVAGLIAAGSILERLDDATLDWLTGVFAKATSVESQPGSGVWLSPKDVHDLVFGGGDGLARWFRWLVFCLDLTCSDFFAAAFAEFQKLQTKATGSVSSASQTRSPSNGASPSPSTSPMPGTFTGSP